MHIKWRNVVLLKLGMRVDADKKIKTKFSFVDVSIIFLTFIKTKNGLFWYNQQVMLSASRQ